MEDRPHILSRGNRVVVGFRLPQESVNKLEYLKNKYKKYETKTSLVVRAIDELYEKEKTSELS